MKSQAINQQQKQKLIESLELAKLAEEKASKMDELAAHLVHKYQQHLSQSIQTQDGNSGIFDGKE